MKKLKIFLVILLLLILAGAIIYIVRDKTKACVNYTLDEAHAIVIRNTEPGIVGQEIRSPRDNSVLQEVALHLPSAVTIRAYYSKTAKIFWILDVSQNSLQWFGPYNGHPCD
jgi:hypothetical protein